MQRKEWTGRLAAIALLIAILFMANSEFRAYIFFIDALGIDVFLLLFVIQIRVFYLPLRAGIRLMPDIACRTALLACRVITRATPSVLAFRCFGTLVCPVLLVIPLTSRCPIGKPSNPFSGLPSDC